MKGGCSLLHRLDLKTRLPSCHDAEEAEQLLLPQGVSSPRSGLQEPFAEHPHSPEANVFPSVFLVVFQEQR